MLRYHPKSEARNHQGRKTKSSNQWASPLPLHRALEQAILTQTELFSSPLNYSMSTDNIDCITSPEESAFGALHDSYSYRWTGSFPVTPKSEIDEMRKTVLQTLASPTDTLTIFLVVLFLPVWEDTPWNAASISDHENMTTLIHLPAGHMRFIPTHK